MGIYSDDGLDTRTFSITEHLGELRVRLFKSLLAVAITTSFSLYFAEELLDYSIRPLVNILKQANRVRTAIFWGENAEQVITQLELSDLLNSIPDVQLLDEEKKNLKDLQTLLEEQLEAKKPIDWVLIVGNSKDKSDEMEELENLAHPPLISFLELPSAQGQARRLELLSEGFSAPKVPLTRGSLIRASKQAAAYTGKQTKDTKLVVLSPLDPFIAYLKVGFVIGLFLACPIWIYQIWGFVAPGLYGRERKFALPVIITASTLFISGGLFCYFLMFPMMFDVLINQMMPETLAASFTVDKYLSILFQMTLAFGVVFELPLILALLSAMGLVRAQTLVKVRGYAIVVAFVVAAVLTPPDPVSQIAMAIPLVIFYEVGILFAKRFEKKRAEPIAEEAAVSR